MRPDGPFRIIFCRRIVMGGNKFEARREKPNVRRRRQSTRGRYRGQTQSQYLSIDQNKGKDEGKAEAHAASDSSRATVSE